MQYREGKKSRRRREREERETRRTSNDDGAGTKTGSSALGEAQAGWRGGCRAGDGGGWDAGPRFGGGRCKRVAINMPNLGETMI